MGIIRRGRKPKIEQSEVMFGSSESRQVVPEESLDCENQKYDRPLREEPEVNLHPSGTRRRVSERNHGSSASHWKDKTDSIPDGTTENGELN
jgi:hypothetical protein